MQIHKENKWIRQGLRVEQASGLFNSASRRIATVLIPQALNERLWLGFGSAKFRARRPKQQAGRLFHRMF